MTARRLSAVLFFSIVIAWLAGAASASAATCPSVRIVQTADGTSYVARFFAKTNFMGPVDVALYTAFDSYAAHIPTLEIATPSGTQFRSDTMRFARPATAPFEAAKIAFPTVERTGGCIRRLRIDATASDPRMKDALDTLPTNLVAVPLTPNGALTCKTIASDARVDGAPATPLYPPVARQTGESGRVIVRISLNPDGSVASAGVFKSSGFADLDQSAVNAAIATRYVATTFLCEPVAGDYVFTADFNR
jgi:TonB family protein